MTDAAKKQERDPRFENMTGAEIVSEAVEHMLVVADRFSRRCDEQMRRELEYKKILTDLNKGMSSKASLEERYHRVCQKLGCGE